MLANGTRIAEQAGCGAKDDRDIEPERLALHILQIQGHATADLPACSLAFESRDPATLQALEWQLDGPAEAIAFWIAAVPWVPGTSP